MRKAPHLLAIASVFAGCLSKFEQTQGEYVLYEHNSELHVCAGNAAYVDKLVPFLEAQLGVVAPEHLRYSWVQKNDLPPWAALESVGVTIGQHAMGYHPFSSHELTHAMMGTCDATFFAEGVAVAMEILDYGYGPRYVEPALFVGEDWDPRPTMTATNSREVDYPVAGVFVTYLLVQHGPERFRSFYRGLNGPVTMRFIEREFQRAYGVGLSAEIEAFMRGVPDCKADAFAVQVPECSTPTLAWETPQSWRFEGSMDCGDSSVVGGITAYGGEKSFRASTVDIPEAGPYVVTLEKSDDAWLRLGRCFGCPWDDVDIHLEGEVESSAVYLEAGRYFVRVGSESEKAADVTVTIAP